MKDAALASMDGNASKKAQEMKIRIEEENLLINSIEFFREKIGRIEVKIGDKLEKIFFPILPYCKLLPEDVISEFNNDIDRSSTK